jgi:hypothetical protein
MDHLLVLCHGLCLAPVFRCRWCRVSDPGPLDRVQLDESDLRFSFNASWLACILMDSLIPFTTSGSLVDCVDSTSATTYPDCGLKA